MESPSFNANDIVIAKVKGYPPWPAIVVTKEYLPETIQESNPKSFVAAPILFFNDNTYKWAAETDLKLLDVDVAIKHSQKPKTKKALREAYRIASERPSIDEYLEMVANPPVEEEPPKKRAKKASEKPAAAPKTSRSSTKSIKRKLKEGSAGADEVAAAEDGIELKRPKQRGRPTAAKEAELANLEDLAASTELRAELCRQARLRVQKALLVEDPSGANFSALNAILDQVEQVESIEIAIIRMSKLRRILKAVVDLEVDQSFKDRCVKLLARWETVAEPVIRGLPESEVNLEELKELEGVIDRETEPPSEGDIYTPNGEAEGEAEDENAPNGEAKDEHENENEPKDEPKDEPSSESNGESNGEPNVEPNVEPKDAENTPNGETETPKQAEIAPKTEPAANQSEDSVNAEPDTKPAAEPEQTTAPEAEPAEPTI